MGKYCKFCGSVTEEGVCPNDHDFKKMCINCSDSITEDGETFFCNNVANKEAAQKYKAEADRLKAELKIAESNAPKERKATMIADARIKQLCSDYPEIKQDKKELKKQKNMAIQDARYEVGAKRHKIEISEKEFEAIQNGAISPTTLKGIMRYTDTAKLRDYASPKNDAAIPKWIQNKISKMAEGSYTISEIASACGISASTVQKYM